MDLKTSLIQRVKNWRGGEESGRLAGDFDLPDFGEEERGAVVEHVHWLHIHPARCERDAVRSDALLGLRWGAGAELDERLDFRKPVGQTGGLWRQSGRLRWHKWCWEGLESRAWCNWGW